MNRLEGKAAVITGAGSGIGRASAIRFASEGAAVAVTDIIEDSAKAVAEEITAAGGRAVGVRSGRAYVDVGMPDGYREAVRLLHAESDLESATPERLPIEGTA